MNVVSYFDGMAGGLLALKRAGVKVDNYFAYEVDKHAIKVAKANHPEIQHMGDVTKADLSALPKIDLLIGGSPCQGFSSAGKGLNFEDPRSKLFFEFVKAKEVLKPRFFFLENVKPKKKEWAGTISSYMGVEPVILNSGLVSAQRRVRYYWTNLPLLGEIKDRGVILDEILEIPGEGSLMHHNEWKKKKKKSNCITASYYKGLDNHGQRTVIRPASIVGRRINQRGVRDDYNKEVPISQCLEVKEDVKTHCLSTVQKDNVISFLPPGRYLDAYNKYKEGEHYRLLTPIECERLQTVPDNYTTCVSDSQRYKMLGNGWTIDIIAEFFKSLSIW